MFLRRGLSPDSSTDDANGPRRETKHA